MAMWLWLCFRCDMKIVSDANQFFIETILEQHGLLGCFSEIFTNPTLVDEGVLRILPYHASTSSPHACNLCPSNLCKVVYSYFPPTIPFACLCILLG